MAGIPDLTFDAGLPANVDAEKTILGAILLDNAAHAESAEKLESDDFSLDSHRRIFLRMSELIDAQHAVDIVTLANQLARYKEVDTVGGVAYLANLTEARLFIDDTAGISLAELRAKARRLKQNAGGLDLIVVDYLQLMSATVPSSGRKNYENRTQEVSAISRGLKALSKELNVPVVALSHLSRASERRGQDKRPLLSDLRESGSIEQDADVVAFIHREAYYNRDEEMSEKEKAKSEIIAAKQRNGPTGTVHLNFISRFTRFNNPDAAHDV